MRALRPGIHLRAQGRALAIATAVLAGAASRVSAQNVGGRVVDAVTGRPIGRVTVAVRVDTGTVSADTGRDGTFVLTLPRAGRYRLELYPDAGPPYLTDSIDVAADAFVQRELPITRRPDPVYFEFQVEKPVVPAPGNAGPRYPAELRRREVGGGVVATFVVDTTGRVRPGTFRVVHATDTAFVSAVAAALATARYLPAELDGAKVAQLVRQPFEFCMKSCGTFLRRFPAPQPRSRRGAPIP